MPPARRSALLPLANGIRVPGWAAPPRSGLAAGRRRLPPPARDALIFAALLVLACATLALAQMGGSGGPSFSSSSAGATTGGVSAPEELPPTDARAVAAATAALPLALTEAAFDSLGQPVGSGWTLNQVLAANVQQQGAMAVYTVDFIVARVGPAGVTQTAHVLGAQLTQDQGAATSALTYVPRSAMVVFQGQLADAVNAAATQDMYSTSDF